MLASSIVTCGETTSTFQQDMAAEVAGLTRDPTVRKASALHHVMGRVDRGLVEVCNGQRVTVGH